MSRARLNLVLAAAVLFVIAPARLSAVPVIRVESVHVPARSLGTPRIAADLDGDGRQEAIHLTAIGPDGSHGHVLTAVYLDVSESPRLTASAIYGARSFSNVELIKYRRTDDPMREGVAIAGFSNTTFSAGERFEDLPLRSAGPLPAFLLEQVLAIGDFDDDNVLDAVTRTVTGLNRWSFDAVIPEVEAARPECLDGVSNRCRQGRLGNFDADPARELLVNGHQHLLVVDPQTLAVEWQHASTYWEVDAGNIDDDPALEIVAVGSGGSASYGIFDTTTQDPIGQFSLPCTLCIRAPLLLGDTLYADGKVELMYSEVASPLRRLALPSGQVIDTGLGVHQVFAAVDLDGDGTDDPIKVASDSQGTIVQRLDPVSLRITDQFALQNRGLQKAVAWHRPRSTELIFPSDFGVAFGTLTAVDPATDGVIWQHPPSSAPYSFRAPVQLAEIHGDAGTTLDLAVLTDSYLVSFSGDDRHELWRMSTLLDASYAHSMLWRDLDGDGIDEVLLLYAGSRIVARSPVSGAVLWDRAAIPGISVNLMQWAQLDADAEPELLASGANGVLGIDLETQTNLFASSISAPSGVAAVERKGQRELIVPNLSEGDIVRAYRLPDMTLLRSGRLQGGRVPVSVIAVPGTDLIAAGTADGRLMVFDAANFVVSVASERFAPNLGLGARLAIAPGSHPGQFSLAGGTDVAYVVALLDLDPPLFADSFENPAR